MSEERIIREGDDYDKISHTKYDSYVQKQAVISLFPGEKVVLTVIDSENKKVLTREYTATEINSHVNILFQSKGELI